MGGGTDVVARHVAHMTRKNLARSTIYQRSRALARLAEHHDLLTVTHDQIVAHVDRLTRPGTRRTEIMHLAGFYRWALEEGLVAEDPTRRVPRPRVPRRLPRPMGDDDKTRALAQAPPRLRPMLYLAAYAGLRACEIAGLHAEHVSYEDRIIYVESAKGGGSRAVPPGGRGVRLNTSPCRGRTRRLLADAPTPRWGQFSLGRDPSWRIRGKGSRRRGAKERVIPLHPALVATLKEWKRTSPRGDYLLAGVRRPWASEDTIRALHRDIIAAIRPGTVPHQIRHSVLTLALDRTGDPLAVRDFAGHASLATTQGYTRLLPGRLRAVSDALG